MIIYSGRSRMLRDEAEVGGDHIAVLCYDGVKIFAKHCHGK